MTNLITMNEITTTAPALKNPELQKATLEIISIYKEAATMADAKNREVAAILARVKSGKLYEQDGFKSVADYAETIFGIKKANAYALATAGEIYADKDASEALKALSPSKLVEVAKVEREALEAALEAGEIGPGTSQKDLREYAKKATAKPANEPEVLEEYSIRVVGTLPAWLKEKDEFGLAIHFPFEDWEKRIAYQMEINTSHKRKPEVIKIPKCASIGDPTAKKTPVQRRLFCTENDSVLVEFYKWTAPKEALPTKSEIKSKYTKAQILNMLAAFDDAETEEDETTIAEAIEAAKQPHPVENPNAAGVEIPGVNDNYKN